jgi:predicted KAP-like P-loop ATPase
MNEIQILTQFKKALIQFFDELIECLPTEGNLVIIRIFLKDQIPIQDVMNLFITTLLPLKPIVVERNERFFIDNDDLFKSLNADNVNHFKTIWQSGKLDVDDKQCVWRWFDSFIVLTERYIAIRPT